MAKQRTKQQRTMLAVLDNAEKQGIITIDGTIGRNYALADFTADLATLKNQGAQSLLLKINSPGGSVRDALALYDAITATLMPVTAQVFGEACSAATVVALAADRVEISANALWMIHEMEGSLYGTEDEIRRLLDEDFHADVMKVATIYAEKTGMTVDEVLAEQKKALWLKAEGAVAQKWCDAVIGAAPAAAADDEPAKKEEEEEEEESVTASMLRSVYRVMGKTAPADKRANDALKAENGRLMQKLGAAEDKAAAAQAELDAFRAQLPTMVQQEVARAMSALSVPSVPAPQPQSLEKPAVTMEDLTRAMQNGGIRAVEKLLINAQNA